MKRIPYQIVYEDEEIIVVNKNYNVLTIATDDKKTFHNNLQYYLNQYLKEKKKKVFLIHRLDYETSGILIFAKNIERQKKLKDCFLNHTVERYYEAVIQEKRKEDTIFHHYETYLSINSKNGKVFLSDKDNGKLAAMDYKIRNPIQIGTSLLIKLETGRKNQIRIGLHDLGFTLVGDNRYSNSISKRMYLNCFCLNFPETIGLKENVFSINPLWISDTDILKKLHP